MKASGCKPHNLEPQSRDEDSTLEGTPLFKQLHHINEKDFSYDRCNIHRFINIVGLLWHNGSNSQNSNHQLMTMNTKLS
ncbi:hypothetical protein TNCV_3493321 [Trichonephila clavipes]|nr:hypothetical protein TNCV_3493321 [Trichonephila clavipes]